MRPTIENAKKQQEYIDSLQQQFGTLEPVDKSLREKSVDVATNVIGALPFGGGGDYRDRQIAKSLFGDYYEENIADSIGVADFTPLGLIYGVDEALREYGEAEKATDYILPTVGLGLSALEAFPLTEVGTRPLRRFLSNLGNKTSAPTDMSRRTLLQGAVAAPVVAGALSEIPLGKVVDEIVPVPKETAPVESIVRLTDLPQMKKVLVQDRIVDGDIDFDDISDIVGRKVDKIKDLNNKEIEKIYEDSFFADGKPSDLFEKEIAEEISDGLDISKLKDMDKLKGVNFPQVELYDNFRKEMKLSGYSDEEISDVIDNSLDDLFNRATSLDELNDEMM